MNNLHKLAQTCIGVQRTRTITSTNYEGLTVISSTTGNGKNTLMCGIMSGLEPKDNLLVLTETIPTDSPMTKHSNVVIQDYRVFCINSVLDYLYETTHQNIFIEQYNPDFQSFGDVSDLIELKNFCKDTGRNVYISVYSRKECK